MAQPNSYPYWATQDEVDPTYGTANKIQPSVEKQDFGQRGDQNTLRQDINWLFNTIRQWIQHFDEQYDINDVYTVSGTGTTENDIDNQLGGSWTYISAPTGAGTLAGQPVQVFIKTGN